MDIIDDITNYFKKEDKTEEASSSKKTSSIDWGHQNYDGKVREVVEDKQIDVNNHKDSYMAIQEFTKHHINGFKLKESITTDGPPAQPEEVNNK